MVKSSSKNIDNIVVTFDINEKPFEEISMDGFLDLPCEVFKSGDTLNSIVSTLSMPTDLYLDILNERIDGCNESIYFSFSIQANFIELSKTLEDIENGITIEDGDGGVLVKCNDNGEYEILKEF